MKAAVTLLVSLCITSSLQAQAPEVADKLDPYVDTVVSLLENHSLLAKQINWDEVKTSVLKAYPVIEHDSVRYAAVRWIIDKYKLKHHSFMSPAQAASWRNDDGRGSNTCSNVCEAKSLQLPTSQLLEDQIGYLKVPMFSTGDSLKLSEYATALQTQIKALHEQGANRWVVDLQGNMGGHMWPMVVGLGPLLGEEKLGSFIGEGREESDWYYKDGTGFTKNREDISTWVRIDPIVPPLVGQRIAVLIDSATMSSGEAVTVAFLGKKNVRTFGEKTGGYSTGNMGFDLKDGSILFITTSVYADRQSTLYYEGITPDQFVSGSNESLESAVDWLEISTATR